MLKSSSVGLTVLITLNLFFTAVGLGQNNKPDKTVAKGVNFLALHHAYESTDAVLDRDFAKFKNDGLDYISVSMFWHHLEGATRGDYSAGDKFLSNVARVINKADEHGLKVLVTIHTMWNAEWCIPKYVLDPVSGRRIGLAVVRSPEMKQAFLDMFTHTIDRLKGTRGIWAWAILNEPWYWPQQLDPPYNTINQKESFIDLIQKLSRIVKTLDGRPVTIRFVSAHPYIAADGSPQIKNTFVEGWGWDQRIFDALDFIGLNIYIPEDSRLYSAWKTINQGNVLGCVQRNKEVWLTECGYKSDDNKVQIEKYSRMMEFFKGLPISGLMPWYWRGDTRAGPMSPGGDFNLCSDGTTGEGRPSYNLFISFPALFPAAAEEKVKKSDTTLGASS